MAFTVRFYNWFQRFPKNGSIENCSWDAFEKNKIVNTVIEAQVVNGKVVYQLNASSERMFKTIEEVLEPIRDGEGWVLIETEPGNDGGVIFKRILTGKLVSFYDVRGLEKN